MNKLVPIIYTDIGGETQPTVNARDLHNFLGAGKFFANWIKDRIEKYGFVENVDYIKLLPELAKTPSGGRPTIEYYISLSMAKELAMVERNAKGREIRLYFIKCEKIAKEKSAPPAIANMSKLDILKLALESEEKRLELERQNKGLQDQIIEDAPLVALAQRVSDYGDAVKLDIAAKAVDVPPMKYRQSVKDMGWLRADGHPMQFAIDRGYMKVKIFPVHHKHGAVTDSYTPLITGKGQVKVAQHYKYSFSGQSDLFARTVN